MAIIIITAVVGIILIFLPFWLKALLLKKFLEVPSIDRSYWMTGLHFVFISLIYSAVIANLSKQFLALSPSISALLIATIIALFTELGRFFLLDKVIKVREKHKILSFSLGYLSVITLIIGLFLLFSSFIYYYFSTNPHLETDFASLSPKDFGKIKALQELAQAYLQQNPLLAFLPLLERIAEYFLGISLSFLVVQGIIQGKSLHIWLSVLLRIVFLFLLLLEPFSSDQNYNQLFQACIYGITTLLAYYFIRNKWKAKEQISHNQEN